MNSNNIDELLNKIVTDKYKKYYLKEYEYLMERSQKITLINS